MSSNGNGKCVVVLVDDEEDVASGLADYINHKYPDFFSAHPVFGKESLPERTMQMVRDTGPDIVVMDLVLNGMDGVDLARLILQEMAVDVLYLTGCPKHDKLRQKAEDTGFPSILKPCSGREVVSKIQERMQA